jgi:hypothetical protein
MFCSFGSRIYEVARILKRKKRRKITIQEEYTYLYKIERKGSAR